MLSNIKRSRAGAYCILLSEDDSGVRRSLQLLLRSKGYNVGSYTSAKALLVDPRAHTGDCLVVDYRMPVIDGVAVLKALRAAGWPKPAILITGHYSARLAARALEAGFADVLEKPLGEHVLLRSIARVLSPIAESPCICG